MPRVDEENVAPQSRKSQKDIWDILQVISAVLIPIVIGVATYRIQKSIAKQSAQVQKSVAEQSVAKDYVGMAVSILEKPNDEERGALRDWAVELLSEKSPLKFTHQQLDELKNEGLGTQRLAELSGGTFGPLSISPDLTKAAMTKTVSAPPRWPGDHYPRPDMRFLLVYDLRTGREISRYDAEPGNWPFDPSIIAWSRDSSKLLVCSQAVGRVIAFDVVQGKRLGIYQGEFPGGRPTSVMESFNFSEDARSVIIKKADGRTETWTLP